MSDRSVKFERSFTQQSALPAESLHAAAKALEGARLHRYGGTPSDPGETALLEQEFAAWQGTKYCLACASGGQAMQIALRAFGVDHGDQVLTNGFTLAPVPGAIRAVGATPVLVEITEDLILDCDDLAAKARASGARTLMLSHMRGHVADMGRIVEICDELGITLIEDCAHTMGATFGGVKSGNFGGAGCFSNQTYKHMNSGEGGFLTTNDPEAMARAIILSGSYMNYERHLAAPDPSYFENAKYDCPNMSARMDNLRAAILRPQLAELDASVQGWIDRCRVLEDALAPLAPAVLLPRPLDQAVRVGSSIQFRTPGLSAETCQTLLDRLGARGVEVKWFGRSEPAGFTSQHHHWRYVDPQSLPKTDLLMRDLFDMRVPLSFSMEDCALLGRILAEELSEITATA